MRLPVNRFAPLAAIALLSACGGGGDRARPEPLSSQPVTGPAADYPMTLGEAFTIEGVTYKPSDAFNYDAVGLSAIDPEGGNRVSAAHKTLPVPSYAEVTALDSGKTILVRIEKRGPMTNQRLIALSPGAVAQLGIAAQGSAAVRVRRVNPPEPERAALRGGEMAPPRMDTPASLLAVLRRKLDQQSGTTTPAPPPAQLPGTTAKTSPVPSAKPKPAITTAKPAVPAPVTRPAVGGSWFVQVGAYSSKDRAAAAAAKSGGSSSAAGKVWRVRAGPYASQDEANAALAKVKAAGYGDARIQRVN